MPNNSRASVSSLQFQDVLSSTRSEKCNICNSVGQGRLWKCNVCRSCKHPACIGIQSVEENHRFVCSHCQSPSSGMVQNLPPIPPAALPANPVPLEYVNLSWSQISAVTTGQSSIPMYIPPSGGGYTHTIMPRYSIAPSSSHAAPFPLNNYAFTGNLPGLSDLAHAQPPYQNTSLPMLVHHPFSAAQDATPIATGSFREPTIVPTIMPPPGFPDIRFTNPPITQGAILPAVVTSIGEPIPIASTLLPSDPQNKHLVQADAKSQSSKATGSTRSSKQQQKQLELEMLDEERKLQEKEEASKREYLRRRYELLHEIASETSSTSGISEVEEVSNEKVNSWLERGIPNRNVTHTITSAKKALGYTRPAPAIPSQIVDTQVQNAIGIHPSQCRQPFAQDNNQRAVRNIQFADMSAPSFNPVQRSTPRQITTQIEYGQNLSQNQVAARQAVSRELPSFGGAPEEWPLFFSTFNSTTEMCGYTMEENLIRLQKCLKGKAYDAVKCRLMHPTNVPGIIGTLKMLYGNPEVIIHNLITKINAAPAPKAEKLDSVIEFALTVQNLRATIEACELLEYSYNVVLLRELVDKLPPSLKLDWAKHRRTLSTVHLSSFADWLYDLAETLCPIASLSGTRTGKNGPAFLNAHSEEPNGVSSPDCNSNASNQPTKSCPVCKGDCVSLDKCQRFLDFGYSARWAAINDGGICRKCLKKHKGICKMQQTCGKNGCSFKHHQLLHNSQRDSAVTPGHQDPKPDAETSNQSSSKGRDCNAHHNSAAKTLFRVVPVMLYGRDRSIKTYAFLDDGSSWTLMDADLGAELNLDGKPAPICLRWTGNEQRYEKDSKLVDVVISGTGRNCKKYPLREVYTVPNLSLFHQSLRMDDLVRQYSHLKGIPAESYENIQPRLLIGVNNANLGHPQKSREGAMYEPLATKTRLGWIIHGGSDSGGFTGYHSLNTCGCLENGNENLHRAMQEYFSLDSLGISKPNKLVVSAEDQRAQAMLQTMCRTEDGRFVSPLLWKFDEFRLPNSKPVALQRLRCLEARLKREPKLAEAMEQKIQDYLKQGFIRKLTEAELNQPRARIWYLPIFPVFNPNKPGKLRIVWDAAAKSQGISLNMMLLKGPDQLTSLNSVLYKFRENKVAICGDIKEMFHQTMIKEEDQNCQRFLWREHPTDPEPSTFIMQVMTFGACCSPSCAQYAKNVNAKEHQGEYPDATETIIHKHYVDDMLASVETEDEAVKLALDVRHVHSKAGYEMRNWLSNSSAVLDSLSEGKECEKSLNLTSELSTEKILGMWWCTATDTFTFKLSPKHDSELLAGKRKPTKREMLRTLMAIFDPLGLICNLLIFLKILLQEVWRSRVGWDDEIPDKLNDKWELWLRYLPAVQSVSVPRCYRATISLGDDTNVQLHTFVDASELGYAAAVYLRFEQHGKVECMMVSAKARVAPLQFISIPRLELQAAVIGSRLAETVVRSLSFKVDQRVYWTDSFDVLCWIRSDHRRYSQFVAFRVSELLETTTISNWNWVCSKDNVADEATKQQQPNMESSSRWFKGPDFLHQDSVYWPTEPVRNVNTTEELRAHLLHQGIAPVSVSVLDFSYYDSWVRLLRVTARLFRYTGNLRKTAAQQDRICGPLSKSELQSASLYIYKQVQQEMYFEEIHLLKSSNKLHVPKSSPIHSFTPFLDDHGILRMRGRIGNCEYATMDAKNPIILPKEHNVTKLIVLAYHVRYQHGNHETVVNELRQSYRIPKLRVLYKSVKSSCQVCKNERAQPKPPLMGDLPRARLAAFARPFSFIGVDYFGPMYVTVGRRLEKRWGVLITCLTIRAIHLEIAHTLNADSCVMALRNFMARRGVPIRIFSDRGTNFVASNKELQAALKEMDQDKVVSEIVSPHTEWEFIPPASPYMGGCWERLVRSERKVKVKVNLQKMKPQRNPSDESLRNMLTEIENIVNSRPLTFVSVDDPDNQVLTPNHFLLGSSNGLKPAASLDDSGRSLKRAWRASQVEANLFWRRWLRYYLPELTKRSKWFEKVKPITIDDIVVVVDPGLPRNCWPLGRIISVKKGKDGQVRTATVQTKNGIYERPTTKLAVLDVRRDLEVSQDPGVPREGYYDPSVGASHYIG